MNFRKMITAIELLAVTGVMSVGFSTWVIVETTFPAIQVQIETENVVNLNEYLSIKNTVFSDYNEEGFYKDFIYGDTISTGYLEFDIVIDLSKCAYISSSTLIFDISLNTNNTNSYDLIGDQNTEKVEKTLASYSINSSESTKIDENVPIDKTPYSITAGGVSVTKYKIDDTVTIKNISNRSDIMNVHLKYGFTLSSLEKLIAANNLNQGIKFDISVVLKGGN